LLSSKKMGLEKNNRKADLRLFELHDAKRRASPRANVVHEAIRREGEDELQRTVSALAWSGFAAGLSMGFSLLAEGLLRTRLPDASWRPLISKFGYTIGFLIVVLGRQQLFTENTLTVVLPLLLRRNYETLKSVLRLWGVVLSANLTGAYVFALMVSHTHMFSPEAHATFARIGMEAVSGSFGVTLIRGIFAGWLIALMVWLLPAAETGRIAVIVILTYMIGLGSFPHIIAGSVETLYVVASGNASWAMYFSRFFAPTLIGNILGGVALVAALNHAQIAAE
jgi:formate-nitrite transporter family protein